MSQETVHDVVVIQATESIETPRTGRLGTIAVDMDDVLCQTNMTIVQMHNEIFGNDPPMDIADFKHYLYWQNRGWGNPSETVEMVTKLYAKGLYMNSKPIPGARERLLELKQRGYRLIIITARSEKQRAFTEDWLEEHMPDIFDELHFTGAFQHLDPTTEELSGHAAKKAIVSHHKRSKAEVVHQTSSLLLIDDSAENALEASGANPPVRVLLFGSYPWNEVVLDPKTADAVDKMTYVEWVERGLMDEVEARRRRRVEEGWMPSHVERVGGWDEVVRWLERWEGEGRPGK